MKQQIKRVVPLLLAIALLIYALKDISFRAISEQFQHANYNLIAVVGLVTVCSYFVRGKRWQQPLWALGYRPTTFRTTIAMQTGLVSSMIVLGSGELTRCVTLQRTDGVPLSQGIGSVVAERVIDLFMLALVLLLTVLLEFGRMQKYLASLTLVIPSTYLMVVIIGLPVIGILISWWAMSNPTIRNHPLTTRAIGVFQGFSRGFLVIRQLPRPGLFLALTLLNQVLAWLSIYLLLLAVDATRNLSPTAALTILAVSSLGGLAVPTQGGIGTYHFLVSRALVMYGFLAAQGAVVATFLHAVGFGINLVLSSASFLVVPFLLRQRKKRLEKPMVE